MPKLTPLKLAVLEHGRLQVDVAEAAEIQSIRFCRACNGRIDLSEAEQDRIAAALSRTVNALFSK